MGRSHRSPSSRLLLTVAISAVLVVSRVDTAELTPDGTDRYRYHPGQDSMVVRAVDTNSGGNLREVWWPAAAEASVDQESCATWTESGGSIAQAGIALRVRRQAGEVQAITITNNIWSGDRSGWNVHIWRSEGGPGRIVGQVLLRRAFGLDVFHTPPLPWRLCGRVVGATVEFKAWSLATHPAEPAWGDPGFGASFRLPAGWTYAGRAGWYVGHLRQGEETMFGSLRAGPLHPRQLARVAVQARTAGAGLVRSAGDVLDGR